MHKMNWPDKVARRKKWRSVFFWLPFLGATAALGILIYKDLTTPLSRPGITDIVSATPSQTEPPTAELKASHSVPPHNPKHLLIPKLNITTNIYPVGITKEKAIDAPKTAWSVGWYQDGTLPGSSSGAALIDGHVNDAFNTPGVFYKLSELTVSDEVTIIRGDDSRLNYTVINVVQEPLKNIDMNKVLRSADPNKEGLNLITCGGRYDKATQSYTDRVIVYTVRTG